MLSELIHKHLAVLYNLPIRYIGRAGNMAWIGFGQDVVSTDYKGNKRVLAKYSLHIQGIFRVVDAKKVLFGSSDIYEPNSRTEWSENFNWDVDGANYYDEQAEKLTMEIKKNTVTVTRIDATLYGDLVIALSNGIIVEIFVSGGAESESWRFFVSGDQDSHFIV